MSNINIPTDPEDRETLRKGIEEIDNAMTRIDAENDYIKESLKYLEELTEIPKKVIRKMASVKHKQNMKSVLQETEDLETLYETLFKDDDN